MLRQARIATDAGQRRDDIPGQHLVATLLGHGLCGEQDGIPDQEAIRPGHARVLALVAAGDHDPCGDLHLAEDVAARAIAFFFVVVLVLFERFRIGHELHAPVLVQQP